MTTDETGPTIVVDESDQKPASDPAAPTDGAATAATDVATDPAVADRDDVATRRPGTRDPHRSRVRALKILFQADVRDRDPSLAVAEIATDPEALALLDDRDDDSDTAEGDLDAYARVLVDGVATSRHRLDEIIGSHSHRWDVARMPIVDRNILRLGTWELLHQDTSPAVVIDEALELAKELSTEKSHRFINGVLEAVRRDRATLVREG